MPSNAERPKRIQRKRTKGWKMPSNTVYVGRPSKWRNPFRVGGHYRRDGGGIPVLGLHFTFIEAFDGYQDATYTTIQTRAEAVEWFRWYRGLDGEAQRDDLIETLRGKNLACWCPLDQPCHADVLLEMANAE